MIKFLSVQVKLGTVEAYVKSVITKKVKISSGASVKIRILP